MMLRTFFDEASSTLTYLLEDEETKEAVIIDPVKPQVNHYLQIIQELGLTLKYAFDTHTHADHITALGILRERLGCESLVGEQSQAACASIWMKDQEVYTFGQYSLEVIYTPGHTDDSYSFLVGDKLFTGDTLLIRGCGRTDFQNGSANALYESLWNKLLVMNESIRVYPGHDYKGWFVSTLGEEKHHNPRLQFKTAATFKDFMDNLKLPNPKMMDVAVSANQQCGEEF